MFDLDNPSPTAPANVRRRINPSAALDELELHLREEIESQMQNSLAFAPAFDRPSPLGPGQAPQ